MDGSYTCGERSIMYKLVETLMFYIQNNVPLFVNYTPIKNK